MANQIFMRVNEVAEELGISIPFAYRIIRQMNEELAKTAATSPSFPPILGFGLLDLPISLPSFGQNKRVRPNEETHSATKAHLSLLPHNLVTVHIACGVGVGIDGKAGFCMA